MVPLDGVVFGLETARCHVRKIGQNLGIKISPNEFGQPNAGAFTVSRPAPCLRGQLANRHGAKTQMNAQITGPLDGRKIAGVFVAIDALQKVLEQSLRATGAASVVKGRQIDGLKIEVGQSGYGLVVGGRPGRQSIEMCLHGVGRQVFGFELFKPSVFVGGENSVRIGGLGEHLLALKHHMVFVGVKRDAGIGQGAAHLGIAAEGLGFVVMVGKDGLHLELVG